MARRVGSEGAEAPAAQQGTGPQGREMVLASAVKDEATFLLEWIAYHKLIGFTRIVLFSNTSSDGTEELLAALARNGEIVHHHVKPHRNQSPQMAAARTFDRVEGYQDGNWYLWLDADEFLNIHVGDRRLDDLVAALGAHVGISLNWKMFGTSGFERFPGRFVSPLFFGASSQRLAANRETKTLFLKSPDVAGFAANAVYRPRLVEGHRLTAGDFLAGNGAPLFEDSDVTRRWLSGDQRIRTNIVGLREMGWALAQINHYSVRTPDHYRLKRIRGRGAGKLRLMNDSRHNDEYFRRFNLNGRKDLSITVWEDRVTQEIKRLMQLPGVAEAVANSAKLIEGIMAELDKMVAAAPDQPAEVKQDMPAAAPVVAVSDTLGEEPETGSAEAAESADEFELTFSEEVTPFIKDMYAKANVILEYGSGGSTVLAAKNDKRVFSVESSKEWAERLAAKVAGISDKVTVHHANVGPTGPWGVPMRVGAFPRFHTYALSVWDREDFEQPDLVLIDGRFRASCLVAVMLRAKRPTTVLFDDYAKRRFYHGVEKLARKEEMIGRMARFTVTPGAIPPEMLTQAIGWFVDQR